MAVLRLVLYTNGVTGARNGADPMFGIAAMSPALAGADPDPDPALRAVRDALFEHQRGVIGRDDQTLPVVRHGP